MTPGAVCPVHPDAEAVATCQRCGRFLCAACRVTLEPARCADCSALVADPLGILAAPFSIEATLRNGGRMLAPVLPKVALIALLFSMPAGLLNDALSPPGLEDDSSLSPSSRGLRRNLGERVVRLYDALVGLIGTLACLALFVGVAEGRALSVGEALMEGVSAWGRVFGARLHAGIITLLFAFLLLLPGLWKAVLFGFVMEVSFRIPDRDALEFSTSLVQARQRWWATFGMLILIELVVGVPLLGAALLLQSAAEFLGVPSMLSAIALDWLARLAAMAAAALGLAMFYGYLRSEAHTLEPMRWASAPRP